jgi:ribosomal protein S18 acetylase RimI-like enzyme
LTPTVEIRPLTPDDREWARRVLVESWGSEEVAAHGELLRPLDLPGLVAELEGEPAGLGTYRVEGDQCQIVSLNSLQPSRGVGTALVEAITQIAGEARCRRVWLMTTNDNLGAIRFYRRLDFRLIRVHSGAVDRSRDLKPEIPEIGDHGIPIRDELEFERILGP